MKKKVLSFAMMLVLALVPMSIFAFNGSGTSSSPYLIQNADDWKQVSRRGANDFVMNQDGLNIFFGVRNGKLYLTNSQELAANTTAGGASLKAAKSGIPTSFHM